jgi:hypothetical protein
MALVPSSGEISQLVSPATQGSADLQPASQSSSGDEVAIGDRSSLTTLEDLTGILLPRQFSIQGSKYQRKRALQ